MDAFAWPAAVFCLGVVAFLVFRKNIARLIDRVTHIDRSGVKAASQSVAANVEEEKLVPASDAIQHGYNEVIKNQEALIKEELKKVQFSKPEEKETLLLRALARSQVYARFDRVSTLIFGSQLNILVEASSRPEGIDENLLKQVFEQAKKNDALFHQATTYDSYKNFLVNTGLLTRNGEKFTLTSEGREFLKFLVDSSLTHQRRG